jgi:hypothetical protein
MKRRSMVSWQSCAAGGLAWAVTGASPASAGSVPYAKLVKPQIMFEKIPANERDKVRVRVALSHADASDHTPIHLWVTTGGKRTDLPLTPDGVLDWDLWPDWVAEGVIVSTDQPDKSLNADVNIDIGIAVPPERTIPDAYLRDAAAQTQKVIDIGARQMAGFLAFFVTPKVRGVKIKLARCCAEHATLADSGRTQEFPQDAGGRIGIPMAVLQAFGAGTLTVSAPVTGIDPWVD